MARFRGTVQGNRGEASRLGHSYLSTACNGWNAGVATTAGPKHGNGGNRDEFTVWATTGSNQAKRKLQIAWIEETENGVHIVLNDELLTSNCPEGFEVILRSDALKLQASEE